MKKILAFQIVILIIFAGALGGLLVSTNVYKEIERKIVKELCLSCIKLKPNTIKEYRFLPDDVNHPNFVLENLSDGPVILHFRITFCPGCNELEEYILSEIFNTSFPNPLEDNDNTEIPDLLFLKKQFKDKNITFIHFNTGDINSKDVTINGNYDKSRNIYDITGLQGNPMLVFITYGYNHGFIEPWYCTLYSIGSGNYEEDSQKIQSQFIELINESIELYNKHKPAVD